MKRVLTLVSALTVAASACDPDDDPGYGDDVTDGDEDDDNDEDDDDASSMSCPGVGTPAVTRFENPETQPSGGPGKRGLTWRLTARVESLGADYVSCGYKDHVAECDAYSGDTLCSAERPLLCVKRTGAANPGVVQGSCTSGWVGATLALSDPVRGDTLESPEHADSICAAQFGDGWRMVEFHEGGGWTFWAHGDISPETRFWVWINDQDANCW